MSGEAQFLPDPPLASRPERVVRRASAPVRIIGCGQRNRQDAQVGLHLASLLAENPPPATEVTATDRLQFDLLHDLQGAELLILVDVARPDEQLQPGQCKRVVYCGCGCNAEQLEAGALETGPQDPSQLATLAHALRIGRECEMLPDEVWLYLIGGRQFEHGPELAEELRQALPSLAEQIRQDVLRWRRRRRSRHAALATTS